MRSATAPAHVGLRSLHEAIDTTTPSGRLMMHVFGALLISSAQLIPERGLGGCARTWPQGDRTVRDDAG